MDINISYILNNITEISEISIKGVKLRKSCKLDSYNLFHDTGTHEIYSNSFPESFKHFKYTPKKRD